MTEVGLDGGQGREVSVKGGECVQVDDDMEMRLFPPRRHMLESWECEGGVNVVGVVTPLVRGGAQVLHGDQVVELSVLLEVHEKEEVEEDGEGQIDVESGE